MNRAFAISILSILFLSLTFTSSTHPQENNPTSPAKKKGLDDEVIRVDTSLVTIPVTVRNRAGGTYVTNLRREDFRIFEDGVEQEIAHFEPTSQPITAALVLDISDSTKISIKDIQNAAIAFLDQLLPADRAFVVAFDKQIVKLTEATGDRKILSEAIRRVKTGGGTSLYDTVESVMNFQFRGIEGRKAIVILTDGIDTTSVKSTFESTARAAEEQYALIYAIQYRTEDVLGKQLSAGNSQIGATIYTTPSGESISSAFARGTRYLRLLSSTSGGRFYAGDSLANLERSFSQIADELRQQYNIGYYPKNEAGKKERRRVKVRVGVSGVSVKARSSYVYSSIK